MTCSRCGTANQIEANFCVRCGQSLRASAVPTLADDALGSAPLPGPLAVTGTLGGYPQVLPIGGWQASPAPGVRPIAAVRYAGFWRRFGAAFVDGILLWFLGAIVQLALHGNVMDPDYSHWPDRISFLVGRLITWLYCAALMSSPWQGTLGELAFDMRVTGVAGNRLSFGRATARHFAEYGTLLVLGLGYLPILFTEKRQALHDLIAGTVVVRGGSGE